MYGKLFASLYQGTLRGDSHGILVFTCLIAHMDQHGLVDMHPRAIAEAVGLSQEQVRAALDALEAPDAESRSPELDGRRIVRMDEHRAWGWRVVNGPKYRAIRNEEDRREQNRLAQARWRERHGKESAGVSQSKPESAELSLGNPKQKQKHKQNTNTPSRPARERACAPALFTPFWDAYPRRVSRAAAEKAWAKIDPDDALAAKIIAAVRVQSRSEQWRSDGGRYIPHASTWLNGRRWEDSQEVELPDVSAEARRRAQEAEEAGIRESIDRAGLARVESMVGRIVRKA